MLSIHEGAVPQDQHFSLDSGGGDLLPGSLSSVFISIALLVITLSMPFLLGAWEVFWPTVRTMYLERRRAQEIVRTITGTYRRMKSEYRWDDPVPDHSGILLNAVLLSIGAIIEKNPEFCQDDIWHDKPSVLFLFDPLRSDSFFVLGEKSFERIKNHCSDLALRVFHSRKRLHAYGVLRLPTAGTWIPLGDGIEVTYQRRRVSEMKAHTVEHKLHLRTTGEDGLMRVERFVRKSLHDYMAGLPCIAGNQRYYFQLQIADGEKGPVRFKQSLLPPTRTFDKLFFPQKNAIMALLDSFLEKRGRFSIEGFPHKLGFLVYGPSGTGKTSFVAALAAYTNRHVISIHLPYITTNSQLYSIFLQRELHCFGHTSNFCFNFDDVIFLLDDVDPTEELVRRRVPAATGDGKGCPHSFVGGPSVIQSPFEQWCSADLVNLSGLLNALDGVVDTPGRIVAMTTRNPDGIDPALLRAGRLGNRLRMEHMRLPELIELLGLHFGDEVKPVETHQLSKLNHSMDNLSVSIETIGRRQLSEKSIEEVRRCVSVVGAGGDGEFSICPAEAESMCLTAFTLDEFLEQLRWRQDANGQERIRSAALFNGVLSEQL